MVASDALEWSPIETRWLALPRSENMYQDPDSITDILLAPSGEVCCLRRRPQTAEVLVWSAGCPGRPESWTAGRDLSLLQIFGFDGQEVFANTGGALLKIQAGIVTTLHESARRITAPALSPNRSHLLWIEKGNRSQPFVLAMGRGEGPRAVDITSEWLHARWLSPSEIVVARLIVGDCRVAFSLHDCEDDPGDGDEPIGAFSLRERGRHTLG